MASDQPHGGGEMSIADMLRQAAEEVVQSHIPEGFRWCDEYNMYYSPTTGYFYDQKNNMYFHHSTQSYYYYDGGKDKLVCYQTVQQKPEWTCREYKRAAGRLFGKPALATMDQSAVDACEITYRLVDMVVSEENEALGKRGKPDSRTRELRREKRKKAMEVYRKRREEKRMERERDRRRRSRSRSRDRSRDRLRKRSRSRSREMKRRSRSRERQSKKGREWDRGKEEYFHDGEWYRHDTGGSRDSRREQERMLLKKREEHERKRRGERQESWSDDDTISISSESDVSWEGDPEKEFFSHEYVDERTKMMQDEGYGQPPLLRLVEPAPLYTLHFITVDGARVGRGEGCDARIGCESADEEHFQVLFSHDNYAYYLLATSNNGVPVTVNGEPVKLNDYAALGHEDTVTVGDYEMRVHIHYGMNSCAGCESGVLSTAAKEAARQNALASARQQPKGESAHRKNLKEMKRAFGIAHHEDTGGGYNDRAGHRRKTMGSDSGVRLPQRKRTNAADGIYAACSAKPLPGAVAITTATSSKAAAKKELSAENKGFKLLKGMGWKEGEGLGKNKAGRVAPVESEQKTTRAGLGAAPGTGLPIAATQKEAIMHMTRQRFSQIPDE